MSSLQGPAFAAGMLKQSTAQTISPVVPESFGIGRSLPDGSTWHCYWHPVIAQIRAGHNDPVIRLHGAAGEETFLAVDETIFTDSRRRPETFAEHAGGIEHQIMGAKPCSPKNSF